MTRRKRFGEESIPSVQNPAKHGILPSLSA